MKKPRAVPSVWRLLVILALILLSARVASSAESSLKKTEYAIRLVGKLAVVDLRMEVTLAEKGWTVIPLLPSGVALKSAEVQGGKGYIEKGEDRLRANLQGPGTFTLALSYVVEPQGEGDARDMTVPLAGADGTARLAIPAKNLAVTLSPEMPCERAASELVFYPGVAKSVHIFWQPEAISDRATLFDVVEINAVALKPGLASRTTQLSLNMLRGELDAVTVRVPAGLDVLRVNSPDKATEILDWRFDRDASLVHIQLKAAGRTVRIQFICEQVFEGASVSLLPLEVLDAARQSGQFGLTAEAGLTIAQSGGEGVRRSEDAARLAFEYARLPARLDLRLTEMPSRITARRAAHVRLQAGVVELTELFAYQIEDRPVDSLRIGLDEEMIVLDVLGEEIDRWDIDGSTLTVHFRRPRAGGYTLTVKALQNLRKINGTLIPRLRSLDAERQGGVIAISAAADVALQHYRSEKVTQVETQTLSNWLREREPKLAYIFEQPDWMLAVSSSLIRPEISVEGIAVARVGENKINEEYIFLLDVQRQPVFNLSLHLPKGLSVSSVTGDLVEDWEVLPADQGVMISFSRAVQGKASLRLFGEREFTDTTSIGIGGAGVRGASLTQGWLGVVMDGNYSLKPGSMPGLTAADIRSAPPLLRTYPNLALAFRWTGDWSLTCSGTILKPRIEVESRSALLFGAGLLRTRTDIVWKITNAHVSELEMQFPPEAVNITLPETGVRVEELADGRRRLILNRPVKGEYRLTALYEQPIPADGNVTYRGILFPGTERQTGSFAVYAADQRVEVTEQGARGAKRTIASAPISLGDLPALVVYAAETQDYSVAFQVRGHAMAEGINISADQCEIATIIKEEGSAVSWMYYTVRNNGAQYFTLELPPNGELWGAFVQDKPVRANVSGNKILIPLHDAPRGSPFQVAILWGGPTEKMGLGGALSLASPKSNLPVEHVKWEVFLPEQYELVNTGGNMALTMRTYWYRQGLLGRLWPMARKVWSAIRPFIIALFWIAVVIGIIAGLRWIHRKFNLGWVSILLVLFFGLFFAGMMLPALARAREESRTKSCASNLKQIGAAIMTWQDNHNGEYPPTLEALYPTYIDNLRVFHCPSLESEAGMGYTYVQQAANAPPDVRIAWDNPDNHLDGRNVLYADGHVNWEQTKAEAPSKVQRTLGLLRPKLMPAMPDAVVQDERQAQAGAEMMQLQKAADGKDKFAVQAQSEELAISYAKRGDLDKARQEYENVLKMDASNAEALAGLKRLDELGRMQRPAAPGAAMRPGEERKQIKREVAAGALMNLQEQLGADAESAARNETQRQLLDLIAGRNKELPLDFKGNVVLADGGIIVTGTEEQTRQISGEVDELRKNLLEAARQVTAERQRLSAEIDARRRAEFERRTMASMAVGRKGGTILDNRASGALPIEIELPSAGAKSYPFYMGFAGTTEPRLELVCLRKGTAVVLQGLIAALFFGIFLFTNWRRAKSGLLPFGLALVVLLFGLKFSGDALRPYMVVALVGMAIALPVSLVRSFVLSRVSVNARKTAS